MSMLLIWYKSWDEQYQGDKMNIDKLKIKKFKWFGYILCNIFSNIVVP